MAADVTEDPEIETEEQTTESPPPRRTFLSSKKIKILALLVLVMGVEAALFYLLVPSPSGGGTGEKTNEEVQDVDTVEVSIDKFRFNNVLAAPGVSTQVQFELSVEVAKGQEAAFEQAANKKHRASVRQTIQQIILSSSLEELNDPAHSVISRKIKEEINKTLRKSYVNRVILNGWNAAPL